MSKFTMKALGAAGVYYSVSDGNMTLEKCPCCDRQMTKHGAEALIKNLERGDKGLTTLRDLVNYYAS